MYINMLSPVGHLRVCDTNSSFKNRNALKGDILDLKARPFTTSKAHESPQNARCKLHEFLR